MQATRERELWVGHIHQCGKHGLRGRGADHNSFRAKHSTTSGGSSSWIITQIFNNELLWGRALALPTLP